MYADEHRVDSVKRKVSDYWGNGYKANETNVYLKRKDEQVTEAQRVRVYSKVMHGKQEDSRYKRKPSR